MKFNFKFLKKGKTVYWIIGGIVLFVIAYYLFKQQGSSSSNVQYAAVGSGATDAQVQAAAAQNVAQIQANAQIAQTNAQLAALQIQSNSSDNQAALAAQVANNQTQAQADTAIQTATLAASIQTAGINAQQAIAQSNNEYTFDTAKLASETQLGINAQNVGLAATQLQTNAQMFDTQLTTQAQEFTQQMQASIAQTALGVVAANKNKGTDVRTTLTALSGYTSNMGGASVSTFH